MEHLWFLGCDQHLDLIEHQSHYILPLHECHFHWTQIMIHQKILICFPLQFCRSSGCRPDCNCRFLFYALIKDLLILVLVFSLALVIHIYCWDWLWSHWSVSALCFHQIVHYQNFSGLTYIESPIIRVWQL